MPIVDESDSAPTQESPVVQARQPMLSGEFALLLAPLQAWSSPDGTMGTHPIHGLYCGDTRILDRSSVIVGGSSGEPISSFRSGAATGTFVALVRHLDDAAADPHLRMVRRRTLTDAGMQEAITLESALAEDVSTELVVELAADFTAMHFVRTGRSQEITLTAQQLGGTLTWSTAAAPPATEVAAATTTAQVTAAGAEIALVDKTARLRWPLNIPARGSITVEWSIEVANRGSVVAAAAGTPEWAAVVVDGDDSRLQRWVQTALADLTALRMVTTQYPAEPFLAAGAPWYFTLFGRDSLWSARMLLPLGTELAGSTLRVLAMFQGTRHDPESAEQPGKIMHELRAEPLTIPGEGLALPPLYYGTVDATLLWICLLHDAWQHGLPDDQIQTLLPHLQRALGWLREHADSDGDGFLEYIDTTGHGLANQGWKDSADAVQWRDGTLAEGPIALCEVQAYAYEAARGAAALLSHFGEPAAEWLSYAAALKARFAAAFWIEDADGGYPAIALDGRKRPVDTLASNMGHLLGTGILTPAQSSRVAQLLVSPGLNSGYGLRTLATDAAGYWPLSYHCGSVWTHDTAIAITGLTKAGFPAEAAVLARGLLAVAEAFDYRVPELHSGDSARDFGAPVPYPAACRPQAWSAAAAVAVLAAAAGLGHPGAPASREASGRGTQGPHPVSLKPNAHIAGTVTVSGLRGGGVSDRRGTVTVSGVGEGSGGHLGAE